MKGGSWEAEGEKSMGGGRKKYGKWQAMTSSFPPSPTPKGSQLFLRFFFNPKLKTVCIFTEVWGCTEILPYRLLSQLQLRHSNKTRNLR